MIELFGLGLFGLGLGLFGSVFGLRLIMPRVSHQGSSVITGGSTAALLWPLGERKKGTEYLGSRQQSQKK